MIDLQQIVGIIVYLLIAAAVFGLLFFLVDYVARKFPGEMTGTICSVIKIVLVVLGVLFLIGLLINLAWGGNGGAGMFRWGQPAGPGPVVR